MEKNYKATKELVAFIANQLSKEVINLREVDFYSEGYDFIKDGFKFELLSNEFDFEKLTTNPMVRVNIKTISNIDGYILTLVPTMKVTCAEEISKAMLLFFSKKEVEKVMTEEDIAKGYVRLPLRDLNYKKVDYRVINFNPAKVEIPLAKMKQEGFSKNRYTSKNLNFIQTTADVFSIDNLRVITIHNIAPKNKEYEKLMLCMENKRYLCYRENNMENFQKALELTGNKESKGMFELEYIDF
jgi:ribosomal protein S17E